MNSNANEDEADEDIDEKLIVCLSRFDQMLTSADLETPDVWNKLVAVETGELTETALELKRAQRTLLLLEQIRRTALAKDATAAGDYDADGSSGKSVSDGALDTIGRFQVRSELGRGAFGVVLLATDPLLGRDVAVKIPRPEVLIDEGMRRRFRHEAEATAQLTHPNIIPVFESGEHGPLVYIVSAFCSGPTLAHWLAQRETPLDRRSAARLTLGLADAVHYAHSKGIVHRDIKPGNVLLESTPDRGDALSESDSFVPRLTDFGLARIIEAREAGSVSGVVVGTPMYMSPEQAQGHASAVGPASDIYSLGVVLYELLTRCRPIQGKSDADTLRRVVSEDPTPPSRIVRTVDRDLEAICLKCLEKDPSARYASAAILREDLGRYLDGRATIARPIGFMGRAWRWSVKYPAVALLTLATISLLVLLAVGGLLSYVRVSAALELAERNAVKERTQRQRAESAELDAIRAADDAQRRANESQQVSDFMVGLFESADPLGLGGIGFRQANESTKELLAVDLLDRGKERIQSALKDQPLARAVLLSTIGNVYHSLGRLEEAGPLLTESLEIRRSSLTPPDPELAQSIFRMGWYQHGIGRRPESEALFREALAMQQSLYGVDSLEVATTKFHLGWVVADDQSKMKRFAEAEQLLRESLQIRQKLLGARHHDVAVSLTGLASIYVGAGEYEKAKALGIRSLMILASNDDGKVLFRALRNYQKAVSDRNNGKLESSKRYYELAIAGVQKSLGGEHFVTLMLMGDYAGLLRAMCLYAEAEATARQVIGAGCRLSPNGHPQLILAICELATILADRGEHSEALAYFQDALRMSHAVYGESHPKVAEVMIKIGNVHRSVGDLDKALQFQLGAREIVRGRDDSPAMVMESIRTLAETYRQIHDEDQANALFDEFVAATKTYGNYIGQFNAKVMQFDLHFFRRELTDSDRHFVRTEVRSLIDREGTTPRDRGHYYLQFARLHMDAGEWENAIDAARKAMDLLTLHNPPGTSSGFVGQACLGAALAGAGQLEEAEAHLSKSFAGLKRIYSLNDFATQHAGWALADVYRRTGRVALAEAIESEIRPFVEP